MATAISSRTTRSCSSRWLALTAAMPSPRASSSWITSRRAPRSGKRSTRRKARAGSRRNPRTTTRPSAGGSGRAQRSPELGELAFAERLLLEQLLRPALQRGTLAREDRLGFLVDDVDDVAHGDVDLARSGLAVLAVFLKRLNTQKGSGLLRSEERRVGKECRSRWSPYH